jgi:CRP/FNR family transcriptional regulator, cyclic AMP receptor protein
MNDSTQIEQVIFEPGTLLFQENEKSFHFFIIQEGEVEVFKRGAEGKPIVLATMGPGNSLGEFAMLDQQPRSASARALTTVTAAKVSAEAYEQLIEELPDWAVSVMRALVERLRATNEIVRKSLPAQAQEALSSTEFSDTTNTKKVTAPDDDTVTDSNFDFSIYDSSRPKDTKLKR